jgi:hypothetical protein
MWQAFKPVRFSQKGGFKVNSVFHGLKTEANLSFNQSIEGGWTAAAATATTETTEVAGAGGRNSEIRRTEITDRWPQIHVIKDVLEINAERQVVAFRRIAAAAKTAAAAAAGATTTATATWETTTTATARETATAAATRTIITTLTVLLAASVLRSSASFATETDGLADAQVGNKRARSLGEIAWNKCRAGKRIRIKGAVLREHYAWPGEVRGYRRTIAEEQIAVNISANGDVEGRS